MPVLIMNRRPFYSISTSYGRPFSRPQCVKVFQQILVHDQHRPGLYASPYEARTDSTEPPSNALSLVDEPQTVDDR